MQVNVNNTVSFHSYGYCRESTNLPNKHRGQVFVRSGWLCLVMDFADGGDLCAAVKERAKSGELFEESAVAWLGDVGGVGWELGVRRDLVFLFHGF